MACPYVIYRVIVHRGQAYRGAMNVCACSWHSVAAPRRSDERAHDAHGHGGDYPSSLVCCSEKYFLIPDSGDIIPFYADLFRGLPGFPFREFWEHHTQFMRIEGSQKVGAAWQERRRRRNSGLKPTRSNGPEIGLEKSEYSWLQSSHLTLAGKRPSGDSETIVQNAAVQVSIDDLLYVGP